MAEQEFNNLYKKLNAGQKEAVDAIDGPVMVIAGPGTGKTTVLTLRIANILRQTDTPPDAILALTFTDSGVNAIRAKLNKLIGSLAYRVKIHTFHSFANYLIASYPDHFPRIIGCDRIDDLTKHKLVQEIIDAENFRYLRPKNAPSYYVPHCLSAISELKRENISPREFKILVARQEGEVKARSDAYHIGGKFDGQMTGAQRLRLEKIQKNKELVRVYEAYEKALAQKKYIDFDDMIMETVRILSKDKDLALNVEEQCQYILADEHQDANNVQNRMLEIISSFHDTPNLFIVGDEKQAIFRFQGASLENFMYFNRKYPTAKVISLEQNYRSDQSHLDAAHSLIENNLVNDAKLNVRLRSQKKQANNIAVVEAPDPESERAYVVEEIKKLVSSGTRPESIAILVRENKDIDAIERALISHGLPTSRFGGIDCLSNAYIEGFIKFLAAIISPLDETLTPVIFLEFLGLDQHESFTLIEGARKNRRSVLYEMKARPQFASFVKKLGLWSRVCRNEGVVKAVNTVAKSSGFLAHILIMQDGREVLSYYESFLRMVERFGENMRNAKVADLLTHIKEREMHGFKLESHSRISSGVLIMTAHRAKGLEFDHVFIMHANDGVWGGKRKRLLFDLPLPGGMEDHETEDERRLFYVALTRAIRQAHISYYKFGADEREAIPSLFVAEIKDSLKSLAVAQRLSPISLKESAPNQLSEKQYLSDLFFSRGLSVTHLNNYLKCPWLYFFVDLLKVPQSQSTPLVYGSAVHCALKAYFDAFSKGGAMSVSKALEILEYELKHSYLEEADLKAYLRSGMKDLENYLRFWDFPANCFNEYKIDGVSLRLKSGREISLKGSLDKIEFVGSDEVNVIDYKTGRPKTRNEIEGKTKNADGNYKRQLTFYKLLLNLEGKWKMRTATLDFVKPDESGKFHREVFEISDAEVESLREFVLSTSEEISQLAFWNRTCDDKTCPYCRLGMLLKRGAKNEEIVAAKP